VPGHGRRTSQAPARYAITRSGDPGAYVYSTTKPYVACNWVSWADEAAYKAWAGLRPMTELEFEKACRGPRHPEAGEFAWGTTSGTRATGIVDDGAPDERASPGDANVAWDRLAADFGPLRAGVFATDSMDRVSAGASYWGIMELSGNLSTRVIGVAANSAGNESRPRNFEGTHGSGTTTQPADWPLSSDAIGVGRRGGRWGTGSDRARVSDRAEASIVDISRRALYGGRGVRSAP